MRRAGLSPGDWLIPLALFAFGLIEAGLGNFGPPGRATTMVALLGGACAALVVRRRYPIVVLLLIGVAMLIDALLGLFVESAAQAYIFIAAVFACGRYARRPGAYAAIPIGAAIVTIYIILDPRDTIATDWLWILCAVPVFVLGAWFRQQRARSEWEATQRVRAAAAEERVRIARELHDVLAHSVSLMVVQAEAADELLDQRPDNARTALRHIQRVGRDALQDTRRLLAVLRDPDEPSLHAPLPGMAQLPQLVAAMRSSGLPVDYHADLERAPVPAVTGRAVYRVVQEALTNTLRHAGHVPTRVSVHTDAGRVVVDVQDHGTTSPANTDGGHGLIGMRERVESCGGTLVTECNGHGFHVRAEIPYTADGAS